MRIAKGNAIPKFTCGSNRDRYVWESAAGMADVYAKDLNLIVLDRGLNPLNTAEIVLARRLHHLRRLELYPQGTPQRRRTEWMLHVPCSDSKLPKMRIRNRSAQPARVAWPLLEDVAPPKPCPGIRPPSPKMSYSEAPTRMSNDGLSTSASKALLKCSRLSLLPTAAIHISDTRRRCTVQKHSTISAPRAAHKPFLYAVHGSPCCLLLARQRKLSNSQKSVYATGFLSTVIIRDKSHNPILVEESLHPLFVPLPSASSKIMDDTVRPVPCQSSKTAREKLRFPSPLPHPDARSLKCQWHPSERTVQPTMAACMTNSGLHSVLINT
uniref:Uncharacterized protein n=1 Tax=Panagrellus redivivus TaxID=6233 RepID=A0A7E4W2S5_PANRE